MGDVKTEFFYIPLILIKGDSMKHIKKPNLPDSEVCLFIADTQIDNATVIAPPSIPVLPYAMQKHADLGIAIISEKKAVCPPESYTYYKNALSPYGFEIIEGKNSVGRHYPEDSAYNVCVVGNKCFLNKNVCDERLYEILMSEGYEIIHINQGYAKCSICPIDENTIITADPSIAKEAQKRGFEVLHISNDGIVLEGFPSGFFGGCTGMGGKNKLLVNGDIDTLPSGKEIRSFLRRKGIEIIQLKEGKITDIGSVLPLMTFE